MDYRISLSVVSVIAEIYGVALLYVKKLAEMSQSPIRPHSCSYTVSDTAPAYRGIHQWRSRNVNFEPRLHYLSLFPFSFSTFSFTLPTPTLKSRTPKI